MSDKENHEQIVLDANRVQQFLNDPSVRAALDRLEKQYYAEFKSSQNPQAREAAWAKARVLDDLATQLVVIVNAGTVAKAEIARKDRNQRLR